MYLHHIKMGFNMLSSWLLDKDSIRIMDFLLFLPDGYFSKIDINRKYKVPFKKMDKLLAPFIRCGMITCSKKIGRSQVYKLVENNKIFRNIQLADFEYSAVIGREYLNK